MIDNTKELRKTNEALMNEDYDLYEELIEKYARKFNVSENLFEDWVTEAREVGEI